MKTASNAVFFDVNCNRDIDANLFTMIRQEKKLSVPLILDTKGLMAKAFQAKSYAVFLVFDQECQLIYKGSYLVNKSDEYDGGFFAIPHIVENLLQHKEVQPMETSAGGCAIQSNQIIVNDDLPILFHGTQLLKQLRENMIVP